METTAVLVSLLLVVLSQPAYSEGGSFGSYVLISRAFHKCSDDPDLFSCLKVRALSFLDRALATDSLHVSDYLYINKDPKAKNDTSQPHLMEDLKTSLPRDLYQKSSVLDKMILDRLSKFLETRNIEVKMPADVFEGRKGLKGHKKVGKGGSIYLLMFGAFSALLLKLAIGVIALIAGKALLVGKLALLLAGVFGLRGLLSQNQEEKHTPQLIYAEPEVFHGGWSRSTQVPEVAHDLAYRGQRSQQS